MRETIETENAPKPGGHYSQGVRVGPFIFTAGMGPIDPGTSAVVGTTIGDQTRQVLTNVQAVLRAAGLDMSDVVKTTVHLAHLDDFPEFNRVYGEFFSPPLPVRTTVGSLLNQILVEIDVVAYDPRNG